MERANSQKREPHAKDPLLQTEQGSQSSSVSNNGETTTVGGRFTVEIESSGKEQTSTPLIADSGV